MMREFLYFRWSGVAGSAVVLVGFALAMVSGPSARAAQSRRADKDSAPVVVSTASQEFPAGNAERGKELYVKNACYQCHGYEGQGGSSAGVRIAPDTLPPEVIAAYIRKPSGAMPPFSSKLVPNQDVSDIYEYLKSRPGPVDIKNIPTFKK